MFWGSGLGLLDFRVEQREVHRGERGEDCNQLGSRGAGGGKPRGGRSSVHTVRRARAEESL